MTCLDKASCKPKIYAKQQPVDTRSMHSNLRSVCSLQAQQQLTDQQEAAAAAEQEEAARLAALRETARLGDELQREQSRECSK